MTAQASVQLFALYDSVASDPFDVLTRIAALGYQGVEPFLTRSPEDTAAAPSVDAALLRRALDESGLAAPSCHVLFRPGDPLEKILDEQEMLGSRYLVVPVVLLPDAGGFEDFSDLDRIKRLADWFNAASEEAQSRGLQIGYHNHDYEFGSRFGGRSGFDVFFDAAEPEVFAEIDVYWAHVGGRDPVDLIRSLGERVPLLHVKDGDGQLDSPSCELGGGVVDLAGVMGVARSVSWYVVELEGLDEEALWPALARSLQWVVERNDRAEEPGHAVGEQSHP
jgi:sugar phosphate isomerase/epimerase